jgi:hypothetical protein
VAATRPAATPGEAVVVRDPVEHLRPELDYLGTVCAGLSLPDPVAAHLEPLVGGWAEMTAAAADWTRVAGGLDALAEDAQRVQDEPVTALVARGHRGTADALRTAAEALEQTSADAERLVVDAAELLADVGRTASLVLSLPVLGVDEARRIVLEADERVRVCAGSVDDLVDALAQRWAQLSAGLRDEPLLAVTSTSPPASAALMGQHEVLSAGGVQVAVTTTGGAHVELAQLPAAPAPVPVAAAAVGPEPATAGGGGAGSVSPGPGAAGGSGAGGLGGRASTPTAAPASAPAPLTGGARVAAAEEVSPARPAAPGAPAAAAADAGSPGRSGSMGGGMMGMGMGGAGGAGGKDTGRTRSTPYVADTEEVFGTPQRTAPPVIGERSP